MPMKKKPGEHPKVEDFNRIYSAKHVHKLAEAHKALKRRYRVGDHVEHVPGIKDEDVRVWRAEVRAHLPSLARAVLREVVEHSLTAKDDSGAHKPIPVKWALKGGGRGGWKIAVGQRGEQITVEFYGLPPKPRKAAATKKRRAK
jgi:hypothetical protein